MSGRRIFVEFFREIWIKSKDLLFKQVFPSHPGAHVHWNPPLTSVHVPPFLQGPGAQGSSTTYEKKFTQLFYILGRGTNPQTRWDLPTKKKNLLVMSPIRKDYHSANRSSVKRAKILSFWCKISTEAACASFTSQSSPENPSAQVQLYWSGAVFSHVPPFWQG